MRIALGQINSNIGNIAHNLEKILQVYNKLSSRHDCIIFPELAITGYNIKDKIRNVEFQKTILAAQEQLVRHTSGQSCAILFGCPIFAENNTIFNAAVLAKDGCIISTIKKYFLPNYSVFNEARNFTANLETPKIKDFFDEKIGLMICEDIWHDDIIKSFATQKATYIFVINASPFDAIKQKQRYERISELAKEYNISIIYANMVGGQDELVFDGGSYIVNNSGQLMTQPIFWQEANISYDTKTNLPLRLIYPSLEENIYQALMMALKDFVKKSGFQKITLGLSGGIDSALVALIAADALGPENVKTIMLASEFTSHASLKYADEISMNIGCLHNTQQIRDMFDQTNKLIANLSDTNSTKQLTQQNIQARIRGMLLMGIANEENRLLLVTSNKSELAVGYGTLYGDMCGAFALLSDIYKTQIYQLISWRNQIIPKNSLLPKLNVIPTAVIDRAPSAELAYEQKDTDDLPPYTVLDKILTALIEDNWEDHKILKTLKIDTQTLQKIKTKLQNSEFKRRQAPLGPKITTKNLFQDQIYPVTAY